MTHPKVPEAAAQIIKATCAVYGAGLTKTGALATKNLVLQHIAPSSMLRPLRLGCLNSLKIRKIAAGLGFSLFASNGKVYGSGLNNFSQIGGSVGEKKQQKVDDENLTLEYHIEPHLIQLPNKPTITGISAGRLHSLVGTSDGVYAFGDNQHGQCGQDPKHHPQVSVTPEFKPVLIPSNSLCKQVHCTLDSSFALLENGDLYSWGLSTDGQLGTECDDIEWKPQKVSIEPLKMIAGSVDTLMAISKTGKLYIWGQVEYHQMSEFTDQPQLFKPEKVNFEFNGSEVQSAAATNTSCIIATKDGEVYTWGSMFLGAGPTVTESSKPILLSPNLFADSRGRHGRVRRVVAGICTVAAINEADNLFAWGANRYGSLALGNEKDQLFPFQVYLPFSVQKLALGPTHTLILTDKQ